MKTNKVTEFDVQDHGIDGSQYFPGCSAMFTSFEHCVTGNGNDFQEALDDALECIAQDGHDVEGLEDLIMADSGAYGTDTVPEDSEDCYYYVSIRYNVQGESEGEPEDSEGLDDPEDPQEPEDGDITTHDDQNFFQYGKLVLTISEGQDMNTAIKAFMDASQFWPNAWTISDHGNAHLMSL